MSAADPAPASSTPAEGRAQNTRATLLSAAREVFAASGFSEAAIADVVARAGASVGSLYHHFGGKSELYLALFEEFQERQEARAARAVATARLAGENGPMELFVHGSRAYLRGCWEERDLSRLYLAGGGPPGFELLSRRRYRAWTHINHFLLQGDLPAGEALVLVLTAVVSEAGHEVALADTEEAATRLTEEVLALVARLG